MKNRLVGALALVSAGLASACCLGPLVLAGLGLSGAGLAAGLERYRPYFLAATAALLALAFYQVYARRAGCETGSCREKPSRTLKAFLWAVTAAAAGLASFPAWAPRLHHGAPAQAQVADGQRIKLAVAGMDCAACVPGIERSLERVPGVRSAAVDFEKKEAVVVAEPGKVDTNRLIDAIASAGPYAARVED